VDVTACHGTSVKDEERDVGVAVFTADRHAAEPVGESELEEFVHGDDVAATGAVTTRSPSPTEPIAIGAALFAQEACFAAWAFVDDVLTAGPAQAGSSELAGQLLVAVAAAEGDHPAALRTESGAR